MKRLRRRSKPQIATSGISAWSARMSHYQNTLASRWQLLPPRDQLALVVLTVFLLLFVGGYGGYSMHQAASESKQHYQEQVNDYFWLRAQAGNIDSNALNTGNAARGAADMPSANRISALLSNAGIANAQVAAAGDSVQFSFTHPSQAVVSTALGKLEQQGWQFTQLTMQQDVTNKAIQVQATVVS